MTGATGRQAQRRGRFITLEGGEGVGKSSNLAYVAGLLESAGLDVLRTREPGGTPLAERVRDIIVAASGEAVPPIAELLLVFAARSLHVEGCIRPALEAGRWVLCDRFTDASYAYQGAGRGLGPEPVRWLETQVQEDLRPDLTLLLDADPEVGLARAGARGDADRFEQERGEFFSRVRAGYLERAAAEPERFRVIDASQSLEAVRLEIRNHINTFIQANVFT
ncbi:dTMP kinase [Wenzhouxiangella sp. XN24]|uniref:dTMP kinase n=1 Tax=Wenzhouxiangella sp. XN24 TaxID=2713569 RepID=UPI0013EDB01C|nr:dTMP kinase [Wenzhouxiangella sp. XN24]NGX16532.1 dTMP kinase [Wenzhouxiangella sp. XN24]